MKKFLFILFCLTIFLFIELTPKMLAGPTNYLWSIQNTNLLNTTNFCVLTPGNKTNILIITNGVIKEIYMTNY